MARKFKRSKDGKFAKADNSSTSSADSKKKAKKKRTGPTFTQRKTTDSTGKVTFGRKKKVKRGKKGKSKFSLSKLSKGSR